MYNVILLLPCFYVGLMSVQQREMGFCYFYGNVTDLTNQDKERQNFVALYIILCQYLFCGSHLYSFNFEFVKGGHVAKTVTESYIIDHSDPN